MPEKTRGLACVGAFIERRGIAERPGRRAPSGPCARGWSVDAAPVEDLFGRQDLHARVVAAGGLAEPGPRSLRPHRRGGGAEREQDADRRLAARDRAAELPDEREGRPSRRAAADGEGDARGGGTGPRARGG